MDNPSQQTGPIGQAASELAQLLPAAGSRIVFAESLTAGLCAASCAQIPGASNWLWGGFCVYDTRSKAALLGVSQDLLDQSGPVCEQCALQMAQGALSKSQGQANLAVSLTGLAGPSGDEYGNPVGTVWVGLADASGSAAFRLALQGDRQSIREQACACALRLACERLAARPAAAKKSSP